jgi:hypothetical protein
VGDFWKCQTFAASPAEPGDLPWWVSFDFGKADTILPELDRWATLIRQLGS